MAPFQKERIPHKTLKLQLVRIAARFLPFQTRSCRQVTRPNFESSNWSNMFEQLIFLQSLDRNLKPAWDVERTDRFVSLTHANKLKNYELVAANPVHALS